MKIKRLIKRYKNELETLIHYIEAAHEKCFELGLPKSAEYVHEAWGSLVKDYTEFLNIKKDKESLRQKAIYLLVQLGEPIEPNQECEDKIQDIIAKLKRNKR